VVIARLFSFWGDGLDDDKAQTIYTKRALKNEDISLRNNGKTIRTYMHGSEMARWLWAILFRGRKGEAYDVGSDTPVTMLELAQQIKRQYNSRSNIVTNGLRDPMPVYMPPYTEKTRKLLKGE
jgi:dTDP-glucose 4,6-dehydratase